MTSQPLNRNKALYWKSDSYIFYLKALFFILMGLVVLSMHLRLSQFAFDDAYIHFRVARNLLDLGTPYFNANEMVKVSTSSGWTVFLATLLFLTRLTGLENNFQIVVSLTNMLITLAGMLVFTQVIDRLSDGQLSPPRKLFFQVSYLALLVMASVGLMEVPFALLLAGLGIHEILKSKLSGFLWLGLASYVRLELAILPAAAGLYLIIQERSRLWTIFFYSVLGVLPFLLYDLYYFQSIIPHSILAKSAVYTIASLQTFTRGLVLAIPILSVDQTRFILGFVLLAGILLSIAVTLLFGPKSNTKAWIQIFSVWALFIFGSYILGRTVVFEWYTPLYTVPTLLAVTLCANRKLFPRNGISTGIQFVLFVLSLVILIQFLIGAWIKPGEYIQFESGSRVKTYMMIGKRLHQEYPGAVLLSSEIGGLGYAFPGGILDAAGLASTDALEFHPMKIPQQRKRGDLGAIPPQYVKKHLPELIVSFDQFAQALLASNVSDQYNMLLIPAYLPEDQAIAKRDTIWGDRYLRVYIRKDLPVSKQILKLGIK